MDSSYAWRYHFEIVSPRNLLVTLEIVWEDRRTFGTNEELPEPFEQMYDLEPEPTVMPF
jgi:hypothetical protein